MVTICADCRPWVGLRNNRENLNRRFSYTYNNNRRGLGLRFRYCSDKKLFKKLQTCYLPHWKATSASSQEGLGTFALGIFTPEQLPLQCRA